MAAPEYQCDFLCSAASAVGHGLFVWLVFGLFFFSSLLIPEGCLNVMLPLACVQLEDAPLWSPAVMGNHHF